MKTILLAASAVVLTVSLSSCSGNGDEPNPPPKADRFDTMWVEVNEAMSSARATTRPETPFDMDVAFGFDEGGPYKVSEFTITDEGTTTRLCIEDNEQDIYLLNTKDGLTYLGEGGCSEEDPEAASVVINPGMKTIDKGEDLVPSAAEQFAQES